MNKNTILGDPKLFVVVEMCWHKSQGSMWPKTFSILKLALPKKIFLSCPDRSTLESLTLRLDKAREIIVVVPLKAPLYRNLSKQICLVRMYVCGVNTCPCINKLYQLVPERCLQYIIYIIHVDMARISLLLRRTWSV